MKPVRHPEAWLGLGVAIAALISIGLIAFLTRTDRGRKEVLAYTIAAAGGRLNGTLVIERLEGSLLSGARVYGISLTGEDGDVLLSADSGYIEYEVPTLIGGDVVINTLVLHEADVFLRRAPGDTLWNYQAILADTTPRDPTGVPRATLIETLRLVNAEVTVRAPWEPDEDLAPAERERLAEAALSDTSRLVVERVPGGYIRTMYFAFAEVRASDLVIAPDERGGTFVRVDSAAGEAYLWSHPVMRLADVSGSLLLREGVVSYEADRVGLGASSVRTAGTIDLTDGEPRYDIVVSGSGVALADLAWLYPQIPADGLITGRLELETRPEGLFFRVAGAELETPDTRIVGRFGMVVGDTLRFTEVDLRAAPLRVETVQRMLPAATPIEGLTIGSVVIEAPGSS